MESLQKQSIISLTILLVIVFFVLDEDPSPVAVAQSAPSSPVVYVPAPASPAISLPQGKYEYLEITEGCDRIDGGNCIPAYAGPSTNYEKIYEVEKGMLLKIKDTVEKNGQVWYAVHFDEWVRYPERTPSVWYIPSVAGRVVSGNGIETLKGKVSTNKRIVVDLSEHMLYAYDGNKEFMATKIATGEELTPTPQGTFTVFKKTPTRYMQGPLPGVTNVPFDLPGVPWNLYFTQGGAVIHGTYWHDRYGTEQSSGCINLPPELAKILYDWADLGTTVIIQD